MYRRLRRLPRGLTEAVHHTVEARISEGIHSLIQYERTPVFRRSQKSLVTTVIPVREPRSFYRVSGIQCPRGRVSSMDYRGAIIDVDGTVVRGKTPISGAVAGIERLRAAGIDPLFVTNNPTKPAAAYVDRLSAAGIDVAADRVVTAGTVTTQYLQQHHADAAIQLVADSGVRDQLERTDLRLTADEDATDVLVASIDREFDYDDLCRALWTLDKPEVTFIGTDPDIVIPAAKRDMPGSGAIIRSIAAVAERQPDVMLGKPSAETLSVIETRLDVPLESCLVIGDRVDTDIALGARVGMETVLVRSGVSDADDIATADPRPDHVVDTLEQVGSLLER